MSDERLDRLIDEVAKQMTAGQPSSDFRARVIASLDRRPRRVWRPIWILAPLGTLAVAVLVIVVARGFQSRDRGAAALQSQAVKSETATVAPKPETTVPLTASRATAIKTPDITSRSTVRRASDAAADLAALAPPPLEVSPLGVEAMGVDALPADSIAVNQLDAIAPMSIDPLPTDDVRPPGGANDEPLDHRP